MELKHIKELMTAMGRTGIKRVALKKEGFEIEIEKEESSGFKFVEQQIEQHDVNPMRNDIEQHRVNASPSRGTEQRLARGGAQTSSSEEKEETPHTYITSPMVGTFYLCPAPEEPHFVKVGDKVEKHTVVCIIEAMKVMNEVKAGVVGHVVEVLVENGHPVEFGTRLFRISTTK